MAAPNVEMKVRGAGAGQVRVTCRTLMALRLVAEWRRIGEQAPHNEYGVKLREGAACATESATIGCCGAWSPRPLGKSEVGFLR
jgi:hypothetical protein